MILHEIQNRYGYVPRPVSLEVSQETGIPLARIYEVITFYNYFELSPPAKHSISVCMGTACYLKGAPEILEEIETLLHVQEGQCTEDGQFHVNVCSLPRVLRFGTRGQYRWKDIWQGKKNRKLWKYYPDTHTRKTMSKFNRDTFITIRNQESADQTDYISVGMSACGIGSRRSGSL